MSSTPTTVTRRQLRDRESDDMKKQHTPSPTVGVIQEKISENATPVSGSKIRTRLSTGTLFMNGTTTIKEKVIKSPALTPESAKIQKEMPGSKRKASTTAVSEPTVIIPPKRRKIGNNDGSGENNKNDYFCWICHKDGGGVLCQVCPRIYHLKCLGVHQVPKDWVCSECEKIMRAECTDTRSRAMTLISLDTLCLLLRYALDRMQQPGSDVFLKPVQPGTAPNYSDYVFNPVDFSTLEKNIKKKQYGCTEAFLADAKWILHNCILYNGLHHRLTNVARNIIKSCKHEMSEIETCPECYQNSCLKGNASWFVEPCHPPHTLVWAKLKGYPFWPAKVLRELNGQVDVRFFGAHDRSWVLTSHVFLLSKDSPVPIKNRKGGFAGAMNELQTHLNLVRERFGTFDYAPDRTPYDQRHEVMKIKGLNLAGNRRFKSGSVSKLATRNKGLLKPEIERVSVASKTASAVKTKYNTMTTKKSGTIISQGRPLIIRQSGKDVYNIITPKPMSVSPAVEEEKSLKSNADPVVPTSKSLVVVSLSKSTKTSITDVIQHGVKAQTTTEEKEESMMSEIKKGNDKSSVSDKMPTTHKVTVKNRNVTEVKKDIALFESQKDKPALLTVPQSSKTISTPVIQQDIKKGKIAEEKEDMMSLENKKRKDKSGVLVAAETATTSTVEISLQNVKEKNSAQEKEVIATLESSKRKDNSSVSDAGSQLVTKASADIIQQKAKESITEEENEDCAILESSTKKDNSGLLVALSKPVTVSTVCSDAILQKAKESTVTEENKGCAALENSKLKDNFKTLDAKPQSPNGAAACAISQQKSEEKGAIGEKDAIFESCKVANSGVLEVAVSPPAKTVIASEVSKQNVKEHVTTEERDCITVLESKKIADNESQEEKGASENVDAHHVLGFADVKVGALVDDSLCAQDKPVIGQDSALDVSLAAKEIQLQSESLKQVSSVANSKDMQTHLKDSVTLTCAKLEINSTSHKMQVLDQESSSTPDLPIFFPIFSSNLQNSVPKSNTEIALFKKDSDYKEALLKTIETCKGKLGITNIEDIEEAMNISDAEEDGDKEEEMKQSDSEDSSDKNCKSEEETSVSKDVSNSEKETIISPFRTETLSVSSQDSCVGHISSIEKDDFTFIKPFPDVLKKGDETVAFVSQTLHADTTATEQFNVTQGKDSGCSNAASKTKIDSETGKREEPVTASKAVVPAVLAVEKKIVQTKLKTEKPIVIEDEDDDEPGLLMEVESEAEHDQLIIDLEDDNLDLQDTGSGLKSDKVTSSQTCKKSNADGFLKELSPSPSVVKKIKQVQDNILRSKLSEPVSTSTSVVSLSTASILSVSSKTMPTISSEVNQPHLKSTEELTASTSTSETIQRQSPKQKTTTSSSTNVSNIVIPVNIEGGSSQDESTLTPAAVKLINKYSTQLMCNMQQNLADMCKELLTSVQPEQEKSRFYQQETDRLKWIHQQEIAEIKHNYKLTIADMKACWEAEMAKNLNDLRRKLSKEKDEAVIGTKKKQWCASCLKEAIYYCCWNTSYCSYDCQQAHWPTHLPSCAQSQVSIPVTATTQNKVISSGSITTSMVQGRPESDLVVMSASLGQATAKGGDKNERSQAQKFNLPPPYPSPTVMTGQEDPWRKNRTQMSQQSIGQTVQYLPSGQQQHQQTSSQPLQQLQYLQSLGSNSQRAPFIQTSQVQLLGQRPSLTNFLPPGAVMSGNTMVLPILRTSQPGSSPTSQNISRQMQYQSMWK